MHEQCNWNNKSTDIKKRVFFPHQNAVLCLINDVHLFVFGGFAANWSTLSNLWHCSVGEMLWKRKPIDWEKLLFSDDIEKGGNSDWKNVMVSKLFQKNTVAACFSADNRHIVFLFAFCQNFASYDLALGRLRIPISLNGEMEANQHSPQISQLITHFEELKFLNEKEAEKCDTILAAIEEENSFLFAINENHFICVPSDFVENQDAGVIYSIIAASKCATDNCEGDNIVAKWECEATIMNASNTTKMICDGSNSAVGAAGRNVGCCLEENIFEEMRLNMNIDLGGILAFQFAEENDDNGQPSYSIGIVTQGTKQKWAEDDEDMEQIRNQTEPPKCYAGTKAQHYMIIFRTKTKQFSIIDSIRPDPRFGYPCYRDGPALTFHQPSNSLFMIGGLWKNVYLAPEQQNRILDEIWRFDLCTFQWTKLEKEMPKAVFNASAQICNDGTLFVFGGNTSPFAGLHKNACSNCCQKYNNDDSLPSDAREDGGDTTNNCFFSSSKCLLTWENMNKKEKKNNEEEIWQLGILENGNAAAAIQQIDLHPFIPKNYK